jgi:hypothetical protein
VSAHQAIYQIATMFGVPGVSSEVTHGLVNTYLMIAGISRQPNLPVAAGKLCAHYCGPSPLQTRSQSIANNRLTVTRPKQRDRFRWYIRSWGRRLRSNSCGLSDPTEADALRLKNASNKLRGLVCSAKAV